MAKTKPTMKGKDKLKAKIASAKEKIAAKCKGAKRGKACAAVALALCLACVGCLDTAPASRATTATYGDIVVKIGDKAHNNKVEITLGDGALASADSAGSTETQTLTPTMDIKPDIDVRYNDALAAASTASKGVLETLMSSSANKVLELMSSKETGTVEVTRKDGTVAMVTCKDGQCSLCSDGSCSD